MESNHVQRNAFLYLMGLVYMFAFGSWFIQIPGLYGDEGLLPIKNVLTRDKSKSTELLFMEKPTILWFFLLLGLNHQTSLEFLCLLGTALSFLCLVFKSLRCMPVFTALWFLYFSLFQVGQTFSWFQWDTLLLESGFLTILVSPIMPRRKNDFESNLALYLVRWLLFRLMFASGVVKLTSMCPTWWGLTALNYHFETQCIPTPLAWWAHQFPKWFLKLSVVATYVIEITLPFLIFAPNRKLRLIAAYGQVLLMFTIILTGNYNFFNILTIVLCLSLFDDQHIRFLTGIADKRNVDEKESLSVLQKVWRYSSLCITIITCSIYTFFIIKLFGLKLFHRGDVIFSKIEFTKQEFMKMTDKWTMNAVWIGTIYFAWVAISTLWMCLKHSSMLQRAWNILKYSVMLCICVYMFCISMVPLNTITSTGHSWPIIHEWHSATREFELVHSYGLFRSMTGVGGRPEVIIEGSFVESGPWKEIPFLYKPGNTTRSPPWIFPHQPRLDWQMWFAALGQYQQNIWLINLVNKILHAQPDVLKLLDLKEYPFKDKPPSYIRADLYLYHFTLLKKDGGIPKGVWTRKYSRSYLPIVHKDDKTFKDFLKYHKLQTKKSNKQHTVGRVERTVEYVRQYFEMFSPAVLLWGLWSSALLISFTKGYIEKESQSPE